MCIVPVAQACHHCALRSACCGPAPTCSLAPPPPPVCCPCRWRRSWTGMAATRPSCRQAGPGEGAAGPLQRFGWRQGQASPPRLQHFSGPVRSTSRSAPALPPSHQQYCAQKFIELGYQSWAYRVVNSAGGCRARGNLPWGPCICQPLGWAHEDGCRGRGDIHTGQPPCGWRLPPSPAAPPPPQALASPTGGAASSWWRRCTATHATCCCPRCGGGAHEAVAGPGMECQAPAALLPCRHAALLSQCPAKQGLGVEPGL